MANIRIKYKNQKEWNQKQVEALNRITIANKQIARAYQLTGMPELEEIENALKNAYKLLSVVNLAEVYED